MESKTKEAKGKVDNTDNNVAEKVDYIAKWKEAKENLLIQLKESLEQIEFHKTRATKIQGVIEVNDQMFLEEEKSEG
jgi:predicted Zn-dependent protease